MERGEVKILYIAKSKVELKSFKKKKKKKKGFGGINDPVCRLCYLDCSPSQLFSIVAAVRKKL